MIRDLMPPLFQLMTGLGFMAFLAVNLMVRKTLTAAAYRVMSLAMVLVPAGILCLSFGTGQSSLGKAGPMIIASGALCFLASLSVGAGLLMAARRTG